MFFLLFQKVVYQCTYPGCRSAAVKSVRAIEAHVRREHLKRPDDHPDDGEEEFYYTEVEYLIKVGIFPRIITYTSIIYVGFCKYWMGENAVWSVNAR